MSQSPPSNDQTVRDFIGALQQGRLADLSALLALDAVGSFPFGSGLFLPTIIGIDPLTAHFQSASDAFEEMSFVINTLTISETGDTVFAQFDGRGSIEGRADYHNTYLMVFEFTTDGQISQITEYYNPLVTGTYFGLIDVTTLIPGITLDITTTATPA